MAGAWRRALSVGALALGLGACQGAGTGFSLVSHGSPAGVPITVESIEGPPATVRTAFASELASAASNRKVDLVGTGAEARYHVRGYLSTEESADGGTQLAFVWDVFDADKRRAKRITGQSPARVSGADPWSGLDKEALRRLAAESMDEIAGFLSTASREPAETGRDGTASSDTGTAL